MNSVTVKVAADEKIKELNILVFVILISLNKFEVV